MSGRVRAFATALALATLLLVPALPRAGSAASARELNREGQAALAKLYEKNQAARLLRDHAKAILVFPDMYKAGFMFGGQIGEGVLLRGGKPAGYYNSVAASYGLQAGLQRFGYALFFDQQGLMAGLGIQGSKITRISK